MGDSQEVAKSIQGALVEVERALSENWRRPGGRSVSVELQELREILEAAHLRARTGKPLSDPRLVRLSKWVADWIPDMHDPLLAAVGKIDRELD